MKSYVGHRTTTGAIVVVRGEGYERPLSLRLDLANHSPTGFEWGYAGSGPAQLALAILADATDDDRLALRLHQRFKAAYIQNLQPPPQTIAEDDGWVIYAAEVRRWAIGAKAVGA